MNITRYKSVSWFKSLTTMIHNICKGLFQIIWDYQSFWLAPMEESLMYINAQNCTLLRYRNNIPSWQTRVAFNMSHSYIIFSFLLLNLFLFLIFLLLFEVIGIVLFISLLDFSLLLPRNKNYFLYTDLVSITLLYSFLLVNVLVDPLRFSIHKITHLKYGFMFS